MLQGCALAVSAASHVGGAGDDTIVTTIDEGTLSTPLRNLLAEAKHLVVSANEITGVKVADSLDTNGSYRVTVDRLAGHVGEMTLAERKQSLKDMCKKTQAAASLIVRTQAQDANTGFMAGIDGRQKIKHKWYLDVQDCKTNAQSVVSGVVDWDTSIYKQPDDVAVATTLANAVVGKLMETVGRQKVSLGKHLEKTVTAVAEVPPAVSSPLPPAKLASFVEADIVGEYANRSESEFVFTLSLQKGGSVKYVEPDMEGGKPFVMTGKWILKDNNLTVTFPKDGKFVFVVKSALTWASFGCKGESFGLASQVTPKRANGDASYHVWRAKDLKRADSCQQL